MVRRQALVVLMTAAFALSAVAEDEPRSPLQLRAEAACRGHDRLKTREDKVERQELLIALADTLESAGNDVHATHCLERAGIFSYQFADYDQAMEIWEEGLALARRCGDQRRVAALLNACAIGVSITGDDEHAVGLQQELILLRREIGDVRGEGVSWYNLAYSYEALYRIPESIESLRQSLRLQLEARNNYGVALSRTALANGLFATGKIEEALALSDSAVTNAEHEGAPVLIGNALAARAEKYRQLGHHARALEDFERARAILVEGGVVRVAAANATSQAGSLVALGRAEEALALLDESSSVLDAAGARAQHLAARAMRGRVLAACHRIDEARAELEATLAEFVQFRAELQTELGRAESFRLAGTAYTDLAVLESGPRAWELVEESAAAGLREKLGMEVTDFATFRAHLSSIGAIGLQFSSATPEYVVVCVITPEEFRVATLELPPDFAREIATAMHLMAGGNDDAFWRPVLARIGAVLLPELPSESDRLVLIPGAFAGLPFEALPFGDGELGDHFAVSYAPSATSFLSLQGRATAPGPMLVLADPTLREANMDAAFEALRAVRRPIEPLPHAREEARVVATGDAVILQGVEATPASFIVHATGRSVIHFATHAIVDASHPDHSAIVLAANRDDAGANPDSGSSLLDAATIETLELHADLVSLSGCSTANGYLVAGEGTYGLARAFLVAGARTVVASWWEVEDAAASRFMELFYGELKKGEDRDRALQHARAAMGEEGYPARDRLAFALIGATAAPIEALRSPQFPWFALWAGLAVILVVRAGLRRGRKRRFVL